MKSQYFNTCPGYIIYGDAMPFLSAIVRQFMPSFAPIADNVSPLFTVYVLVGVGFTFVFTAFCTSLYLLPKTIFLRIRLFLNL